MGGCRCCFRQCPVATKRNKGIHFFKFPLQHPDRFEEWIKLAGVEHFSKLYKPELHNKVICARHFPHTHFMNYKNDRLTISATPTLNRISEEYALDYSKDVNNPSLIKLPPVTQEHLIPPKGYPNTMYFTAADRKIADQIIKSFEVEVESQGTEEPQTYKRKENCDINPQETKRLKRVDTSEVIQDNYVIFFEEDENGLTGSTSSDDETSLLQIKAEHQLNKNKKTIRELTKTNSNESVQIVEIPGETIFNDQDPQLLLEEPLPEILKTKKLEGVVPEHEVTKNKLLKSEKTLSILTSRIEELSNTNEKLKRDIEISEKQFKKVNDELIHINSLYETLRTEHNELQKECSVLRKQQQQECSSIAQQQQQPRSQQQLTKIQLFNGIKKYLSQTMAALLRIQLSPNNSEREWRQDERRLAVDLMGLGEQVYKYFTDEWLLRLPPLRQVEVWRNEANTFDPEDYI